MQQGNLEVKKINNDYKKQGGVRVTPPLV